MKSWKVLQQQNRQEYLNKVSDAVNDIRPVPTNFSETLCTTIRQVAPLRLDQEPDAVHQEKRTNSMVANPINP